MSRTHTSNGKRRSSQAHARRVHVCVCGRSLVGNGGWSSHKKACPKFIEASNARKRIIP